MTGSEGTTLRPDSSSSSRRMIGVESTEASSRAPPRPGTTSTGISSTAVFGVSRSASVPRISHRCGMRR